MLRKLLLGSLLLISCFVNAQQSKIDSLTIKFNTVESDTAKAHILSDIGILAYRINLNYAKEINDSLISFSTGRTNKWLIQGYRMQGTFSLLEGDYKTSEEYYTKALSLAQKINDTEQEASLLGNLGTFYGRQGERKKAKEFYLQAIEVNNESMGNPKFNIRPYINLAITVAQENELEGAVEYLVKALKIAEEFKSTQTAYIHNELGKNYLRLNRYDKAEFHLKKALTIAKKQEDSYSLATIHNSLGYLYEARDENYVMTLYHYEKSLYYHTLMKNKRDMTTAYYNTGLQYQRLQKFQKAKENFEEGLRVADSLDITDRLIDGKYYLATLYVEQGNINGANTLIKSANTSLGNNSKMPYKNHFFRLSKAFEKNKKYNSAFKNMEIYTILSDSLFQENGTLKIAEIETKYQTEKKEKELAQQRESIKEQQLITEKANKQKWLFGSGLIGSLIALSVFAFYYRKNKRQKQTIELLQKDLHHRVKNNLSIIDTFIEVAKEEFSNGAFDDKLTELQNRIDSINEVHLQLYKNSDVTRLDVKRYIETLSKNIQDSFSKKEITINHTIDDTLSIDANKSFPIGLIINEFLTNSYKYAFENETGIIDIAIHETNEDYKLSLSDNGQGLPEDFVIEQTPTFGLRFIKLLSKELDGIFDLKSGIGVHLNIQIPK